MFEVMEMPMDWPAEVNYHEAKAFCAWKGSDYRLPTEAEHHAIRGPQVRLWQSFCQQNLLQYRFFFGVTHYCATNFMWMSGLVEANSDH